MSSLDIEALLQELSEDAPCGDDLEYDAAFIALEQSAKGVPEQQIGSRIEPAQPPNWREVRRDALALLERTRDLRVILTLVEAELQLAGLEGLRCGLKLMSEAVLRFWDSLHPALDPDDGNDPTQRVNILMGLCDGELFLRPLLTVPLLSSRALGSVTLRDFQIASGKLPAGEDDPTAGDFSRIGAVATDCGEETLVAGLEIVSACMETLDQLEQAIVDRVGIGNAEGFGPLRDILKDIKQLFVRYSPVSGGEGEGEGPWVAEGEGGGVAATGGGAVGAVRSRQDVLRVLDLVSDYYLKNEPSSPIPLLINRAKKLVPMDFMAIMRNMAPGGLSEVENLRGPEDEQNV
ncbi:MAG: type VI secretion system protein TssA [Methylococcaceae bacterium]|nr:type VI secretion system protein TssA [Methylococcaceae bacterium]